jgi:hypothetical protein
VQGAPAESPAHPGNHDADPYGEPDEDFAG